MPAVALSGSDTVNIQNQVLSDLADGNCVELTFPEDIAVVKIGKNGNAIYGLKESGKQAEVKLRVLRASTDDKFLNSLMSQQDQNFAGFPLMIGTFVKKVGDGLGNITSDTYIMSGGIFSKHVEGKMNVDGETDQSVSMYTIRFASAARVIT